MGIQDKNTKNNIKSKDYPKSKTLRELEKLETDRLVYSYYKAKCTVQWAEEHIRKDVCSLNSKPASTTNTQIFIIVGQHRLSKVSLFLLWTELIFYETFCQTLFSYTLKPIGTGGGGGVGPPGIS